MKQDKCNNVGNGTKTPSFVVSLIPVAVLLAAIVIMIITSGAEAAQAVSHYILLAAAVLTTAIAVIGYKCRWSTLWHGIKRSATQILPAVPILALIGTVAATWMMSGVVPTLIYYGLDIISPSLFLFLACAVCSAISVLSGSSWTTIATIGVAFMGIGSVMGYSEGWIAGAVISGAYFGDKVSPLSDTTVLASSSCGVDLFTHIKYLMITTIPSMLIAMLVFLAVGLAHGDVELAQSHDILAHLQSSFNLTPWTLIVPAVTCVLIVLRVKTLVTLAVSTLMGLVAMFVFQPQVASSIGGGWFMASLDVMLTETAIQTGNDMLDSLVATGGVEGMMPTIYLVLCAMTFGGVMIGSGMIASITRTFTRRLHSPRSIVGATVGSGMLFNSFTGDQYLSIILGGNVFKKLYEDNGLERRLLSRSLEDSISVTSVLIPWNSCGVTQSTVLGVATLTYLPYCIFNYISPIMSLIVVRIGYKIVRTGK